MGAGPEREVFTALDEPDKQLVRMVCSGLTDQEIAERLQQSEGTVAERLADLLARIGAASRTQLVISAVGHGL